MSLHDQGKSVSVQKIYLWFTHIGTHRQYGSIFISRANLRPYSDTEGKTNFVANRLCSRHLHIGNSWIGIEITCVELEA